MATYHLAHVRHGGQDIIIIPMDSSFGSKSSTAQDEAIEYLEDGAWDADLAGDVAVIWQSGGKTYFRAPSEWCSFFESPGIWDWVQVNINTELTL